MSTAPFKAPGFPAVSTRVPLSQPAVCGRHDIHGRLAGRQQQDSTEAPEGGHDPRRVYSVRVTPQPTAVTAPVAQTLSFDGRTPAQERLRAHRTGNQGALLMRDELAGPAARLPLGTDLEGGLETDGVLVRTRARPTATGREVRPREPRRRRMTHGPGGAPGSWSAGAVGEPPVQKGARLGRREPG